MSIGRFISDARKKIPLSQKQLAANIKKEDGASISAQYLTDIEHDRRTPSNQVIEELARVLELGSGDRDYLYHLAGTLPSDVKTIAEKKKVVKAYKAFRRALKG